jgi:thiol-disulfide isomerase/thioredoxin
MINVLRGLLFGIMACAIELLLGIVRGDIGLSYSTFIGFFLFFFVAYISFRLTKRLRTHKVAISLFLGVSALYLPPRFIDFQGTLISFPDYIFHVLGLLSAYLFYVVKSSKKWIAVGFGFATSFFMFFKGYSMWLHKLNFGTYTGYYYAKLPQFSAVDKQGNIVSNDSLADKLVLLDFWHTQCGACFRKFPALNELYLKYKDNENVEIFALNLPLESDRPTQAYEMISKRRYSFTVAKLKTPSLIDSLSISVYPTTILINEKGYVIFKGSLDNGIRSLERSIKNKVP